MITVEITELGGRPTQPQTAGTITWDGGRYIINPQEGWLDSILDESLTDPDTGETVTADDPERFLRCLQFKYRSAYFRANPPVTT